MIVLVIGFYTGAFMQLSRKKYCKCSLSAPIFSGDWTNAMQSDSDTDRDVS